MERSWVDLKQKCPINLERIKHYYNALHTSLPENINEKNLDSAKQGVLQARAELDSMITALVQLLSDSEILKDTSDKILYMWLAENFARYLRLLDEDENLYIIKFDDPSSEKSRVGIGRICAYARKIKTGADSIIYESLLKATNDYYKLPVEKREPKAFLYTLFLVLNMTMAVSGGIQRLQAGSSKINKKDTINALPLSAEGLMSKKGKKVIKEGYQEDTGLNVDALENTLGDLDLMEDEENVPSD